MAQTGKIEPKEVSRQNVKLAVQIFLRTVLAAILSFFLYFSITAIVNGVTTHAVGYRIYEYDENNQPVLVAEGSLEEESSEESSSETPASESSGTAATEATKRLYRETVRSEVPAGAAVFRDVLSQVLMLLILASYRLSGFAVQAGGPRMFGFYADLTAILAVTLLADGHSAALLPLGGAAALEGFQRAMRMSDIAEKKTEE